MRVAIPRVLEHGFSRRGMSLTDWVDREYFSRQPLAQTTGDYSTSICASHCLIRGLRLDPDPAVRRKVPSSTVWEALQHTSTESEDRECRSAVVAQLVCQSAFMKLIACIPSRNAAPSQHIWMHQARQGSQPSQLDLFPLLSRATSRCLS